MGAADILTGELTEILAGDQPDGRSMIDELLSGEGVVGGELVELLAGGADDEEIGERVMQMLAGAERRPQLGGAGLGKMLRGVIAAQAKANEQASLGKHLKVTKQSPQRARSNYLGVPATAFLANQRLDISVAPDTIVKPKRLLIPSTLNDAFVIRQITIGRRPQLPSSDGVPARNFDEKSNSSPMTFDTWNYGQRFVLDVENITAAPATFRGSFEVDYLD